jgi:hypothetical protein
VVEGAKYVFRHCLTKRETPAQLAGSAWWTTPQHFLFLGNGELRKRAHKPVWLDDLGNEAWEIALEVRRAFALDDEVAVLITVMTGLSTTISHTLCD